MISVDKAVLARLDTHGHHFEILIDPQGAIDFRHGIGKIEDVVAVDEVYKDSAKGEKAGEHVLKETFGTEEFAEIATQIIKKGSIQLTTEIRHEMHERTKKKIVTLIARDAVNPQTGMPHPPQRIENAMEEARVQFDIFKKAEDQIELVIKAIKPLIPISFETRQIAVKIPGEFAGKAYSTLRNYHSTKEEWQSDGSLVAVVEIPAGMQPEFMDEMNKVTKGNIEIKIIKRR